MTSSVAEVAITSVWKENPYIIGRPIYEPEQFFGREDLFQFITDNLSQRAKVILLHGQRRIGKSSVLRQIPNFVRLEDFVFVPFDLQGKAQMPLSRVLYDLTTKIANHPNLTQDKVIPPTLVDLENNQDIFAGKFLPQVYEVLGSRNLVLLIDEFDVLSDYSGDAAVEHFFPYLQSTIYRQEKLFIIPVVGRRLNDMPTLLNLFKNAPTQEIGLLDERSAKRLITKPARDMLKYSDDAIQSILELSSRHPYFTQLLCHVLFARARDEQRSTITQTDVESIVDKAIESGEAGLAWFRDGLPIPERVVFSAVAELQEKGLPPGRQTWGGDLEPGSVMFGPQILLSKYGVVLTDPLRKAEARLVEWGFLRETKPSDPIFKVATYKVTVELVRRWLVKRHPLRREILQLECLDDKVHRDYEKAVEAHQRGDVLDAMRLYEQVLEANLNHFHALFKLIDAYWDVEESYKAVESSEEAYQLELNHLDTEANRIYNEAVEARWRGDVSKAHEQYKKVLEDNPDLFSALSIMVISWDVGKLVDIHRRLVDLCSRAYRFDPMRYEEEYMQALLNYERSLMRQKKFEEAAQTFAQALYLKPDNPDNKDARTDLLKELVDLYSQAYRSDSMRYEEKYMQALLSYGHYLMQREKFGESARTFAQALYLKPDNEEALEALEKIESETHKVEEGWSYYLKWINRTFDD